MVSACWTNFNFWLLTTHNNNTTNTVVVFLSFEGTGFDIPFCVHRLAVLPYMARGSIDLEALTAASFHEINGSVISAHDYSLSVKSPLQSEVCQKCPRCVDLKVFMRRDKTRGLYTCVNCAGTYKLSRDMPLSMQKCTRFQPPRTFPFSEHIDLRFKAIISENLANKKLDTVCLHRFKKRIIEFQDTPPLHRRSTLLRISEMAQNFESLCFRFAPNTRCIVFTIDSASNQVLHEICSKIVQISCSIGGKVYVLDSANFNRSVVSHVAKLSEVSATCEIDIFLELNCKLDEKYEHLQKSCELFVSVGKTSEISLDELMRCETPDVLMKIASYCVKDVLLTFGLESIFKTLKDIYMCELTNLSIGDTLNKPTSFHAQNQYVRGLVATNYVSRLASFKELVPLFWAAMRVEVPSLAELDLAAKQPRYDNDADNILCGPLETHCLPGGVKVLGTAAISDVKDYWDAEKNLLVHNEHMLKIAGEVDTSDLDAVIREVVKAV